MTWTKEEPELCSGGKTTPWGETEPQNLKHWNNMMYMRRYRQRIKDYRESKEYREQVKANETIWIKKSNIIYGDKSY